MPFLTRLAKPPTVEKKGGWGGEITTDASEMAQHPPVLMD